MQQIPCRIYNLKEEFTQTPEDAERKLYEQALTGDSTDGYSGCPTVGPKRAGIILDQAKESTGQQSLKPSRQWVHRRRRYCETCD